jgi:hypothetical protein
MWAWALTLSQRLTAQQAAEPQEEPFDDLEGF